MKLKYYMRGLGIGIILTTLILSISGYSKDLTDQEIKERALKLGMIMKEDKDPIDLDKVFDDKEPSGDVDSSTSDEDAEPSKDDTSDIDTNDNTSDTDINDNPSETEEKDSLPEPTAIVTPVPTATPIPTSTPVPTATPIPTEDAEGLPLTDTITFTIERGMSSRKVSELLAQKGLIDDPIEFNEYITRVGKAGVIRIGTYTLPQGATFEDILNEITS